MFIPLTSEFWPHSSTAHLHYMFIFSLHPTLINSLNPRSDNRQLFAVNS